MIEEYVKDRGTGCTMYFKCRYHAICKAASAVHKNRHALLTSVDCKKNVVYLLKENTGTANAVRDERF